MKHKFPYEWTLKEANFTKDKGKVFSCFACGGGSTMGYKLAGFDVIGCNEIDPRMAECYKVNHNPKYCFVEPIQTFKDRDDLPAELYELDILDGSPPCSSFSMAGNREKDWGKKKKFREGQAEQVLDTLFFDFINLAAKLKPKVVIAENVKGMLLGEAQQYVSKVLGAFDDAGYYVDFKLLNASNMGVPQRRERVFFYAVRKDLYQGEFSDLFMTRPVLDLRFDEDDIPFSRIHENNGSEWIMKESVKELWQEMKQKCLYGGMDCVHPNGSFFGEIVANPVIPCATVTGQGWVYSPYEPRKLNALEFCRVGTYPIDYNFNESKPEYLIGMSVPPVMMAQIATRVYEQWLQGGK